MPLKTTIRCVVLALLLVVGYSTNAPDERLALIDLLTALNDTKHSITDWDVHTVSPCYSWSKVTCRNDRVVALSLASNGFTGTVSPSITQLQYLENLELQDNDLHGPLPDYLGSLVSLQYLNLAQNAFSGSIPTNWSHFPNLGHLDLSSNNLYGIIPSQLFSVPRFNFTGTRLVCGPDADQPCVSSASAPDGIKKSGSSPSMIAGCLTVILLLSIGAIFAYRHWFHKFRNDNFVGGTGEDDRKIAFGRVKRFSWREIQLATNNFSGANIVGQGGFGKVYKGTLMDGTIVAVKRLVDHHNPGGEAAFLGEVQLISVAVHKNLLRLIGFCTTSWERILVYPFLQNLSVAYHLRDLKPGEKCLDWPTRERIALGTAHGLEYLHEHCTPKITHQNLKAANILLDENFEAVLGDFGLAKLVDSRLTHVTTQVGGTMGHIAPEYLSTGKSSEKTDVFGYGITLLQIVTGRRPIDFSRLEGEEDVLLLDHIKKLLREDRVCDIVDSKLKAYDLKQVERMIRVALLCTQSKPEHRPSMTEVVAMLVGGVGGAGGGMEEEASQMDHRFAWADELTDDQEAVQLSAAR